MNQHKEAFERAMLLKSDGQGERAVAILAEMRDEGSIPSGSKLEAAVHSMIGIITYLVVGDVVAAYDLLVTARTYAPSHGPTSDALVMVCMRLGRWEEAREEFERFRLIGESPRHEELKRMFRDHGPEV